MQIWSNDQSTGRKKNRIHRNEKMILTMVRDMKYISNLTLEICLNVERGGETGSVTNKIFFHVGFEANLVVATFIKIQ